MNSKVMKKILGLMILVGCLWGCGAEGGGDDGAEDNLKGKTYERTFTIDAPDPNAGTYTRRLVFSADKVEDNAATFTGGTAQSYDYTVLNETEVKVTIAAGQVQNYTLSEDRNTLTQETDPPEVFTLVSLGLLANKF